jgi:hypothetical protein
VALVQVFLRVFRFFLVSIISPMLRNYLRLLLTRTSQKQSAVSDTRSHWADKCCHFVLTKVKPCVVAVAGRNAYVSSQIFNSACVAPSSSHTDIPSSDLGSAKRDYKQVTSAVQKLAHSVMAISRGS